MSVFVCVHARVCVFSFLVCSVCDIIVVFAVLVLPSLDFTSWYGRLNIVSVTLQCVLIVRIFSASK